MVKPVIMKTVTNYEDFMARKSVEDLEDSLDDNSIEVIIYVLNHVYDHKSLI